MSVFDFEEEIERERASAASDNDRAIVRTTVSRQRLPEAVRAAGWNYVFRGDAVDLDTNSTVVVGVAAWNAAELRALGSLDASGSGRTDLWIFDIDDYENPEELVLVLPGVKAPTQTPVVAEYLNGRLVSFTEGPAALDILANLNR